MKNSFAFAVIISLVFSYTSIYSQGIFLERGEAGFFLNGGYTKLENGSSASYDVGFGLGGLFELGVSQSSTTAELDNRYQPTVELKNTTVSLGVILLKNKTQLEANIGYSTSDNSVDVLLLGFNVGSKFDLHSNVYLYPIFFFAIGLPQGGNSSKPITAIGFSAPFLIARHVYFGPSFGVSEGNLSWGTTAGIIISFNTNSDIGGW